MAEYHALADDEPLEWKPALALAAASAAKQPLPATHFCQDSRAGGSAGGSSGGSGSVSSRFLLGSLEGELAAVDAASYNLEHRVGCLVG